MIRNLQEGPNTVEVQETTFSIDVLGRYVCNTYEEALSNGGFPFDAIVIGAGMYGAYVGKKSTASGKVTCGCWFWKREASWFQNTCKT